MDIRSILENAQRQVSSGYDSSMHSLMDRLGLEQKRNTMEIVMPAIAIFGAGLAAGAALGLMFAPKRGDEIRTDIKHRVGDLRDRSMERVQQMRVRGEQAMESEQVGRFPTNGAQNRENTTSKI